MAPRKLKTQGKKNNVKIKSKSSKEKPKSKLHKKVKKCEKSIENLKWLNKMPDNEYFGESVPQWLNDGPYKLKMKQSLSGTNVSETEEYPEQGTEEDCSDSEISEECNCKYSEKTEGNMPQEKSSSSSVVSNYIKSGMDQVAYFIVESAIKFGEQHGVIVPDKKNPNVYEFTPADTKYGDKYKKIRFKVPNRTLNYENAKKLLRRSQKDSQKSSDQNSNSLSKIHWREKGSDSIEKIIPILEKLKKSGDLDDDDLDLGKTRSDSESMCDEHSSRERSRDRIRVREKRHKSVDSAASTVSEKKHPAKGSKWSKFRRDSLELGRRRLKAANCYRKQENPSPTPS